MLSNVRSIYIFINFKREELSKQILVKASVGGLRGLTPRIRSHFTKTLKSRKKDLSSKKISKKVAKYVLDCFRTGRSLKQERVPPNSLEELLIKLQAAEVAFEQAIDYLDDIGDMRE
jgi:hypothetical protein